MAINERNQADSRDLIGDNPDGWINYMVDEGPEAYRYRRLYEATLKRIVVLETYLERQDKDVPGQTDSPS